MKKAIYILLVIVFSLSALAQDDSPTAGLQFVIRVIEASSDSGAPNDAAGKVPTELKEILKHTAYSETGVVILRGRDAEFQLGDIEGEIDAEIVDRGGEQIIEFDLEMQEREKHTGTSSSHVFSKSRMNIETSDIAKDGETVVLGASSLGGGNATIVLMTVNIIR